MYEAVELAQNLWREQPAEGFQGSQGHSGIIRIRKEETTLSLKHLRVYRAEDESL